MAGSIGVGQRQVGGRGPADDDRAVFDLEVEGIPFGRGDVQLHSEKGQAQAITIAEMLTFARRRSGLWFEELERLLPVS
jgi:hypothetical protein